MQATQKNLFMFLFVVCRKCQFLAVRIFAIVKMAAHVQAKIQEIEYNSHQHQKTSTVHRPVCCQNHSDFTSLQKKKLCKMILSCQHSSKSSSV